MKKPLTDLEIKECELNILLFVHELCCKHKLKYFLAYGTLLGAIRHQGFIPWDDDIDIMMPRSDYERLQQFVDKNGRYQLLSIETNGTYSVPFAKIIDTKTTLKQQYKFKENTELGIYIDIFILDGVPVNSNESRDQTKRIERVLKKWYWANTGFSESNDILRNTVRFVCTLPYKMIGARKYVTDFQNIVKKYAYEDSSIVADYSGLDPFIKCSYSRQCFGEGVLKEFEGHKFYVPANYDEVLTKNYGKYMDYPPVEQQQSVHNFTAVWR